MVCHSNAVHLALAARVLGLGSVLVRLELATKGKEQTHNIPCGEWR